MNAGTRLAMMLAAIADVNPFTRAAVELKIDDELPSESLLAQQQRAMKRLEDADVRENWMAAQSSFRRDRRNAKRAGDWKRYVATYYRADRLASVRH